MNHKVYIVVVTYNGLAWLQQCLSSCKGYPVIVVDNTSTDQTVSFIKQNFPEVVILPQSKNLGFGQANNIGISYALKKGAEHFFLLNQDAYIVNDSLSKLVAFQKEHSDYGILSPIHLNSSCDKMDFQFSNYVSYNKNKSFYSDFVLQNEIKPVYDVPFVNAAAWLINKKCVNTVGGFDPIFFHYGEDNNYCQRVKFHGLKIGIVPNQYIIHDRTYKAKSSIKKLSSQYFIEKEKSYKIKFGNPNYGNFKDDFQSELNKVSKLKVKALFRLNLMDFKGYSNLKNILKKSFHEAEKSRIANSKKGTHYLIDVKENNNV